MKTKFGPSAALIALVAVTILVVLPATGQAGTPPNSNGDRLWTRDQLRDGSCDDYAIDVADLDRLRIRDKDQDRDRDRIHLLPLAPPIEELDGYVYRHRVQERAQHNWYFFPGLAFALIWPGTF